MASLLESYLDFFYAKEIIYRLSEVVKQTCEGCALESLSQMDHTCVMMTKRQQLSYYFEDVLKAIDEQDILGKWKESVASLEDVSPEYLAMYELKLHCADWRDTMKTSEWKYRMIKMAVQVMRLERCF